MNVWKKFNEYVKNLDDGVSLTFDYSGRCMYGKECFGIRVNRTGSDPVKVIMGFVLELSSGGEDDCSDALEVMGTFADNSMSTDSLGTGMIYYWPGIKVDNEDRPDYNEDGEEDD